MSKQDEKSDSGKESVGVDNGAKDLEKQIAFLYDETRELQERVGVLEAMGDSDRLYSVADLRKRWGVSERTVRNIVEKKYIEPTYINSVLRFTKAAIEAYENGQSGWYKGRRVRRVPMTTRINPITGYAERVPVQQPPRKQ